MGGCFSLSLLPAGPPGLAGAGLGQARWVLVGHPGHKIFAIKLVTTCLGYIQNRVEGRSLDTPIGWYEEAWISSLSVETDKV